MNIAHFCPGCQKIQGQTCCQFTDGIRISRLARGFFGKWGGGCWSPTLNQLRAEGYTVYNYEPFSCHNKDSFLISDPEHLKTMRFDGIFSNNLLEHLPDPVGEILFMKTLLKNRDSLMLHSTPCFEYAYEYTRFHLIFFTGRALEYLANKTNFSVRKFPKTTQGNNFSIMALFQQR